MKYLILLSVLLLSGQAFGSTYPTCKSLGSAYVGNGQGCSDYRDVANSQHGAVTTTSGAPCSSYYIKTTCPSGSSSCTQGEQVGLQCSAENNGGQCTDDGAYCTLP